MASTIILSDNGVSSGSAGLKETGGNDGVLILQTTTSGGTATNAVYVDNYQRVGIGATPSSWNATYSVLSINSAGNSLVGFTANDLGLCSGMYYNGGWKWAETNSLGGASYEQYNGTHYWAGVAPTSHTAGNAVASLTTNLVLNATGALVLQSGNTSANGVGLTFPATQSASTDANTLDDYEEGTWTPVILFGASNGYSAYSAQSGTYTKIGNVVTVRSYIYGATKSAATGSATLSGLPFATKAGASYQGGGLSYAAGMSSLSGGLASYSGPSNTSVVLGYYISTGFAALNNSNFTNTTDLMFQWTYLTD